MKKYSDQLTPKKDFSISDIEQLTFWEQKSPSPTKTEFLVEQYHGTFSVEQAKERKLLEKN